MMENELQTTVLMDESLENTSFKFQLPTRATKLDPVFKFTFKIDETDLSKTIVRVVLNPKLAKQPNKTNFERQYHFNNTGICLFENEEFDNYFIEGEIILNELYFNQIEKSCFLRITYGNRDEALHYIKGNFQISKNTI